MKKTLIYPLLACAAILWGVSFILTKELFLTEPALTVTELVFLRLLLATAVTIPALALMRKLEPIRKGDLKWFLLLSFAEPFCYHLCETGGVQLVSGSLASVIIATIPLFVPFGMAAVYREKVRGATLVGVLLSMVGLGLILFGSKEGMTGNSPLGLLYLAGAVVVAVAYTLLLVKVVKRYRPITITAYQNVLGMIYFVLLLLMFDKGNIFVLHYTPKFVGLILALGIFCSTLAYAFYNVGIRHLGASAACIFTNTIPIFSLIAAICLGQEVFSWNKAVGIVVVIVGVILAQREG